MLLTLTSLTLTLTLLARSASGHPCDAAEPNTFVCDPSRNGYYFYFCMAGGFKFEYACPAGLVFVNEIQRCDWVVPGVTDCVEQQTQPPLPTTTPAVPITSTPSSNGTPTPSSAAPPNTTASASSAAPVTTTKSPTTTTPPPTTTAPFPSGTCNPSTCALPECRCVGRDIPGGFPVSQVPQMVLLTFDDAIVSSSFLRYDKLFPADEQSAVKNPNGCRTRATFFVSGDYTDMNLVKTLSDRDQEMASHSISHGQPADWSRSQWDQEINGMRKRLAEATGRNLSEIAGMRAPYLSLGGENQFSMLRDRGFVYDSSMYGGSLVEDDIAPLWPFSLKYPPAPSQAVCDQPNCPQRSYPDLWEVPLIRQYALDGSPCSMTDSCSLGANPTQASIVQFLEKNFNRHYSRNRAPFMISLHPYWFDNYQATFPALRQFLDDLSKNPDVWQVSLSQMLDWVRNPKPLDRLDELPSWQC